MADASFIPPPSGVISNFDHPRDVLRSVNITTQYLCIPIITIFVALRLFVKARYLSGLQVEDYITLISWAFFIAFCVCMLLLSYHGGGYNAWDVRIDQRIPFMKLTYVITIIYVPMAFFVKVALLSIVIRVFAPARKKVIAINAVLGVLLLYYCIAIFVKIFFCHPISAYWEGTEHGGACFDQQKVIIADSVISVTSDFLILVIPIPLAWSLHMTKAKKLRIITILGAGGIATAFSVWRFVMMVEDGSSPNYTILFVRVVLTGNAEAGIGLICACLPALNKYLSSRTEAHNSTDASSRHLDDNWQRMSAASKLSKRTRTDHALPYLSPDQVELISVIESSTPAETRGSRESLPSQATGLEESGGICRTVIVSQSYEHAQQF